jgi:hypothetical protein
MNRNLHSSSLQTNPCHKMVHSYFSCSWCLTNSIC